MRAGNIMRIASKKAILSGIGGGRWAAMLSVGATASWGADGAIDAGEAKYMSGRLVEQARGVLRDGNLTPTDAAREAAILLQFATKLNDGDVQTLKMLAESARVAGDPGLRKDTLRQLIKLDPGDFVAQVQYLDLLAGATEVMEDRARIYQSAMDQAAFNPQIRSEMAVRLAQISDERGALDQEKNLLGDAVHLNSVNVAALRGLARLAAQNSRAVTEQLSALVALVSVDPYQPDAWLQMARICERVNLHDRAADYLETAIEQMQWQGVAPSGELYLEMGTEFAIAGRSEAPQIARGIANLPDVPLSALVVAELATSAPGAPPAPASTLPASESVPAKIEKLLAELVKKGTEGGATGAADSLADAAGIELTIMPQISPDAATWVDSYANLVAADDATLGRLRGWQLYREGKLDAARAALEKAAASDPMAQVGLARVLIDQGNKEDAAKQLQEIWSSHPTDLLALQVAQTARRGQITLADTTLMKQVKTVAASLPAVVMTAHRQPRENMLISASVRKNTVALGEPILLTIRMTNAASKALPVGAGGVALTTVGLAAATRGTDSASLGLYALEDLQRVYRIEPQGVIEATIRADQGKLAAILERDPSQTVIVGIEAATGPRVNDKNKMLPGLGGQLIQAEEIQRMGWIFDVEKLPQELLAVEGDARLARIQAVVDAATFNGTKSNGGNGGGMDSLGKLKGSVNALLPFAKSADPLVRAALLQALSAIEGIDEVKAAADGLSADPDPLVRISWATGAAVRARAGDGAELASLEKRAGEEKDPLAKEWMELQLQRAKTPTTQSTK